MVQICIVVMAQNFIVVIRVVVSLNLHGARDSVAESLWITVYLQSPRRLSHQLGNSIRNKIA